jgi:hypothetical protein
MDFYNNQVKILNQKLCKGYFLKFRIYKFGSAEISWGILSFFSFIGPL